MTTLTERLRELEAAKKQADSSFVGALHSGHANSAIALAQELHALLVECGETLTFYANPDEYCHERKGPSGQNWIECDDGVSGIAESTLTKLKQAGIV